MKNLYRSIVLSMALVVPMVSGAATVTNSFTLGNFPASTSNVSDGTMASSNNPSLLPGVGNSFVDNFTFTVAPGGGTNVYANISLNGVSFPTLLILLLKSSQLSH